MTSRHYVVRLLPGRDTPRFLTLNEEIFERPMLWLFWLKAMFSKNPEWRIVYLPEMELTDLALEDGDVLCDGERQFYLEMPSLAHAVVWAIESIIYGTSLKFWKWKEFTRLIVAY